MSSHSFLLFDISQEPEDGPPTHNPMFDVQALSFDRVHAGHITSSGFPLFKFPVELFTPIVRYLSKRDLKSLALVDRDCCRLASLSLFKDVQVDVPSKIGQMLIDLWSPSDAPSSIRHCIRQLTVSSSPSHVPFVGNTMGQSSHGPSHPVSFALISSIVTNPLPNLYILDWSGPAFHSSTLLQALHSSPVKHLRLNGIVLDPGAACDFSHPIPLESLDLQVTFSVRAPTGVSVDFYRRFLHCIAPTLCQLRWKETALMENVFGDVDMLPLPNLRSLALEVASSASVNVLRFLLGEHTKVHSLTLSMDSVSPFTRIFFTSRGYVKSLKHFCWINHSWTHPSSDVLSFLEQNPQLETVHITQPVLPIVIEDSLVPLFREDYDALTSLHLVWDASEIPEQSLRNIASISTLRHLWLSAGNQGSRSTWEVDHKSILKHLSHLRLLETLAFSHDTYPTNAHPLTPRFSDYYATKALPVDLDVSKYLTPDEFLVYQGKCVEYDLAISQQILMRRRAWENWHAEHMVEIANKYAWTFKVLSWCFIGQLPLGREGIADEFSVVCESFNREPSLLSLHKKLSMNIWRPV